MASTDELHWIPGTRLGVIDGVARGELRHVDDDPVMSDVFRWLTPAWNTLDDSEADAVPPSYRHWAEQVVMVEPGFDGTTPHTVLRGFERDAIELRFRAGRDAYLHLPGNELARREDAFYMQRLLRCAAWLVLPGAPRPLGDQATQSTLSRIERAVDPGVHVKLRAAIEHLIGHRGKDVVLGNSVAAVAAWQLGVHCSAHRVGLMLAGDLQSALALAGRRRHGTLSFEGPAREDLQQFANSPAFARVAAHLGITVPLRSGTPAVASIVGPEPAPVQIEQPRPPTTEQLRLRRVVWSGRHAITYLADLTGREDPRPLEDRRCVPITAATLEERKAETLKGPAPDPVRSAAVERAWSSLRLIAESAGEGVDVRFVNASHVDLVADFEDAPNPMRSGFRGIVNSHNHSGMHPTALAVVDIELDPAVSGDLRVLSMAGEVAATFATPVLFGVSATAVGAPEHARVAAWRRTRAASMVAMVGATLPPTGEATALSVSGVAVVASMIAQAYGARGWGGPLRGASVGYSCALEPFDPELAAQRGWLALASTPTGVTLIGDRSCASSTEPQYATFSATLLMSSLVAHLSDIDNRACSFESKELALQDLLNAALRERFDAVPGLDLEVSALVCGEYSVKGTLSVSAPGTEGALVLRERFTIGRG